MVELTLHNMHSKVLFFKHILIDNPFNCEYVHEIIFLCGKSNNLLVSISSRFKDELIFKSAKFQKRNKYEFVHLMTLNITDMQNKQEEFLILK